MTESNYGPFEHEPMDNTVNVKKTKLKDKTLLVFNDFIRKRITIDFIKEYRKRLGIPEGGLKISDGLREKLSYSVDAAQFNTMFFIPDEIFPLPDGTEFNDELVNKIISDCDDFVKGQGFEGIGIFGMFRLYLFFNEVFEFPLDFFMSNEREDFASIEYVPDIVSFHKENKVEDGYLELLEVESSQRPIALFFHPNASFNDIKDFLSMNWGFVESHRDKETFDSFNKRKKPRQEINDFIYKNSSLKISEIRSKLADELGEFLDDGHISKIRNNEKKKRN